MIEYTIHFNDGKPLVVEAESYEIDPESGTIVFNLPEGGVDESKIVFTGNINYIDVKTGAEKKRGGARPLRR